MGNIQLVQTLFSSTHRHDNQYVHFQEEDRKQRLRERARKLISETRDSIGKPESEFIHRLTTEGAMAKTMPASTSQNNNAADTGRVQWYKTLLMIY